MEIEIVTYVILTGPTELTGQWSAAKSHSDLVGRYTHVCRLSTFDFVGAFVFTALGL